MRQERKEQIKRLEDLWREIIKAQAGYMSEYSGKRGLEIEEYGEPLNSHHINGKENFRLKFSLINGFCMTEQEHIYGLHDPKTQSVYEDKIKRDRGEDIFDRLNELKNDRSMVDLNEIEIELNDAWENLEKRKQMFNIDKPLFD